MESNGKGYGQLEDQIFQAQLHKTFVQRHAAASMLVAREPRTKRPDISPQAVYTKWKEDSVHGWT